MITDHEVLSIYFLVLTILWSAYSLCEMQPSPSSSFRGHSAGIGGVGTQRADGMGGSHEQRVEHCLLIRQSGDVDSISLNDTVSLVQLGRIPAQ